MIELQENHDRSPMLFEENLVLYEDGEAVQIETGSEGIRFILVSGKPLNEPIAWPGPIVMNTRDELRTAFKEYQSGTFLKHSNS
jgi:hypothetical protein